MCARGAGPQERLFESLIKGDRNADIGVVVGLEASEDGEYLYRKVGFQLLSRFYSEAGVSVGDPNKGGVMIWTPSKLKDT